MSKLVETIQSYQTHGLLPYLDASRKHLADPAVPKPETKTTNAVAIQKEVVFSFADNLLEELVRHPRRLNKPHDVAVRFGLNQYSRGGKNGIFYQRPKDGRLARRTASLIHQYTQEIAQELDIKPEEFSSLHKVKIVYHQPSGERVVGVYNPENKRILFLGFAHY